MKVLLVLGNYLPEKNGGIENYSHWLAKLLQANGYIVEIACLKKGEWENYVYEGVSVNNVNENINEFINLLTKGSFDICHFQEFSEYGGIDIEWIKGAKNHKKKVFFTFHLPYLTCYKGDFRFNGVTDCDNFTDSTRCASCKIADSIGGVLPSNFAKIMPSITLKLVNIGLAKSLEKKIIYKHKTLLTLVETCDKIFVIANWFNVLLKKNGFSQKNIHLIKNKTAPKPVNSSKKFYDKIIFKLIFIGRIQQQKGLHLLCKAAKLLKGKNIEIDVYGNVVDPNYFKRCFDIYAFNYKGVVQRSELLTIMKNYDFLVLPSVFTEMYPMVIMDAVNLGLPVIASNAKGNKDIIFDSVNGFLFKYDDYVDLKNVISTSYELIKNGWSPRYDDIEITQERREDILPFYTFDS